MQASNADTVFSSQSNGNRNKFICLRELFQAYVLPGNAELCGSW